MKQTPHAVELLLNFDLCIICFTKVFFDRMFSRRILKQLLVLCLIFCIFILYSHYLSVQILAEEAEAAQIAAAEAEAAHIVAAENCTVDNTHQTVETTHITPLKSLILRCNHS